MVSCSKCDFQDAEPGSLFCKGCSRGIEFLNDRPRPVPREVGQPNAPRRFSGPPSISRVHAPRATGHDRASATLPRMVERVSAHEVSEDLKDILKAALEGAHQLPPQALAGKAPRAHELLEMGRNVVPIEIDKPIHYVGPERKIELDESELNRLSKETGVDSLVLRYLLITHGSCHEAMRRRYEKMRGTVGPKYEDLDIRIREHYSQLVMYYLLFAPLWVMELLGETFDQSLPNPQATGFLRDFEALNALQSGHLYVDRLDFTNHPPTAIIEYGVRFPARKVVNNFEEWHEAVIGRPATVCVR